MEFIVYSLFAIFLFKIINTIIRTIKERKIVNMEEESRAEETRKPL